MKLSEIKGERTLDVLADLIEPVCNIAQSDAAKVIFNKEKPPKGMAAREYALVKLKRNVPALIRCNKADIIAILATLDDKTPEAYAAGLTPIRLVKDVTDLLNDSEFQELFFSAQQEEKKPSSAAPETTTGAEA